MTRARRWWGRAGASTIEMVPQPSLPPWSGQRCAGIPPDPLAETKVFGRRVSSSDPAGDPFCSCLTCVP